MMKHTHHTSYSYPPENDGCIYDRNAHGEYILEITLSYRKRSDEVTKVYWIHCVLYFEHIFRYFSHGYMSIIPGTSYLFLPRDSSRGSTYRMHSHDTFCGWIYLSCYSLLTL